MAYVMGALWVLAERAAGRDAPDLPLPPVAGIANDLLAIAIEEEEQIEEAMEQSERRMRRQEEYGW